MEFDPIAVALKFGFLAVLYLFLVWVTRSVLKDLRQTSGPAVAAVDHAPVSPRDPVLIVERGGGLKSGDALDLFGGVTIGRSADADIRIKDRYASQAHARLYTRRGVHFVEDMKSTNGTLLNDETLQGEAELQPGDVIRIGDTEFRFEA